MKFGFDSKHLKGDFFGGLTAGIVALPLALAFGVQSGMGSTAGLYGAIFISFFATLFGGTNTQISGPTAPMTAVSMVIIATITSQHNGSLTEALPYILMVFVLAGLFQILLGVLKVGQYIRYIPYPVISGFMTGIGVIILITQLLPAMGYYPKEDAVFVEQFKPQAEAVILERILYEEADKQILVLENFEKTIEQAQYIDATAIQKEATVLASAEASGVLGALKLLPNALGNIQYAHLLLTILTLVIIYGFKRITTTIPSSLVALLVVTAVAYFGLGAGAYRTIGDIPSDFPKFYGEIISQFSFGELAPYIFTAMSLAALGAIDSLLTSIVADNMTKTQHEPNQELIGQGIGNVIASFFGGIPGAGATVRTVVNIDAGGRTKLSGMIAGVFLLIVLLTLAPLASQIPSAALAGILITVGIGVMDYKGLKHSPQLPKSEVLVMVLVLVLTVFVGLIQAVLVGLLLSSLLFMKHISDVVESKTKATPLAEFSRELAWEDEATLDEALEQQIYIKHLDGPLFFGFANRFQQLLQAIPTIRLIIIRMDRVPYVDQSGLYAMENAILRLQEQGVKVAFVDLHGQPYDLFASFNIIPDLIPPERCFESFEQCLTYLKTAPAFDTTAS